jgi:lipid-binding SYLF domain-containing protein
MTRTTRTVGTLLACGVGFGLGACQVEPDTSGKREALTYESRGSLSSFTSSDPSLDNLLNKSVGYAVFPSVGKAGFIVGGAYGRGEVYERGAMIGYADITQGSIGLQAGAQTYDELVIFLTDEQLNKFKNNQFAFSANVSAVAIKPGAGAAADHSKGVVVFIKPQGGLMAEASIGGQEFKFVPLDQARNMNGNRTTTETTTETYERQRYDNNYNRNNYNNNDPTDHNSDYR